MKTIKKICDRCKKIKYYSKASLAHTNGYKSILSTITKEYYTTWKCPRCRKVEGKVNVCKAKSKKNKKS